MRLSGSHRAGAATIALACALGALAVVTPSASAARLVRNDSYTGTEDTMLRVKALGGVLANDPVRRLARRLSVVRAPAHGTIVLGRRGAFRYRPAADWSGRDTFRYAVVDKRGRRSVAVARILVKPADDPTTTRDDTATSDEDVAVSGNVLDNDADIDSALRILADNHDRAPGSFTIQDNGAWTYRPEPNWSGVARIGYATTTGGLGTLTVTVRPVDDPTVTGADFASAPMNSELVSGNVLTNDVDVDSTLAVRDDLTDASAAPGDFGMNPDGSWTYTPEENWTGDALVRYVTNTGVVGTLIVTIS